MKYEFEQLEQVRQTDVWAIVHVLSKNEEVLYTDVLRIGRFWIYEDPEEKQWINFRREWYPIKLVRYFSLLKIPNMRPHSLQKVRFPPDYEIPTITYTRTIR